MSASRKNGVLYIGVTGDMEARLEDALDRRGQCRVAGLASDYSAAVEARFLPAQE